METTQETPQQSVISKNNKWEDYTRFFLISITALILGVWMASELISHESSDRPIIHEQYFSNNTVEPVELQNEEKKTVLPTSTVQKVALKEHKVPRKKAAKKTSLRKAKQLPFNTDIQLNIHGENIVGEKIEVHLDNPNTETTNLVSFGNKDNGNMKNAVSYVYDEAGEYIISVAVIAPSGESATVSRKIIILEKS